MEGDDQPYLMRGFLPFLGPGEGFSRYSSHFWELWMRGFLNTLAILWEWIGLDILAIFGGLNERVFKYSSHFGGMDEKVSIFSSHSWGLDERVFKNSSQFGGMDKE